MTAVTVHEVFAADSPQMCQGKLATTELFAQGLVLYEQQKFAVASYYFQNGWQQNPSDRVAKIYLNF